MWWIHGGYLLIDRPGAALPAAVKLQKTTNCFIFPSFDPGDSILYDKWVLYIYFQPNTGLEFQHLCNNSTFNNTAPKKKLQTLAKYQEHGTIHRPTTRLIAGKILTLVEQKVHLTHSNHHVNSPWHVHHVVGICNDVLHIVRLTCSCTFNLHIMGRYGTIIVNNNFNAQTNEDF